MCNLVWELLDNSHNFLKSIHETRFFFLQTISTTKYLISKLTDDDTPHLKSFQCLTIT